MHDNTTISDTSLGWQSNPKFSLDGVTWNMVDGRLLNLLDSASQSIISCVSCTINWTRVEVNNFNKQLFDIENG